MSLSGLCFEIPEADYPAERVISWLEVRLGPLPFGFQLDELGQRVYQTAAFALLDGPLAGEIADWIGEPCFRPFWRLPSPELEAAMLAELLPSVRAAWGRVHLVGGLGG